MSIPNHILHDLPKIVFVKKIIYRTTEDFENKESISKK
jgi:hypothetical protein